MLDRDIRREDVQSLSGADAVAAFFSRRASDRYPKENPVAVVVSLLERGDAPYAIVTNGKHWRLYSSTCE